MPHPIVLYKEASVNLANLWLYGLLKVGADKEKVRLRRLMDQVNSALSAQAKTLPDLENEVNRLKREIRLITKGTPVTEPLDPASMQPILKSDPNFNQQQYDAESVLLKQAYRLVAMLAHPDKGGTQELFDEVRTAYLNRDLPTLTHLYLTLSKGRNLYWQQSDEGVEHMSNELERPRVITEKVKASPVYVIARLHIAGKAELAKELMEKYLKAEILSLLNELNYLGAQNG